jgi:hypothetical protein
MMLFAFMLAALIARSAHGAWVRNAAPALLITKRPIFEDSGRTGRTETWLL